MIIIISDCHNAEVDYVQTQYEDDLIIPYCQSCKKPCDIKEVRI